jgi:hypothetical protein
LVMLESKMSKLSIETEDMLSKTIPLSPTEPSKVGHEGTNLDPK